MKQFNALKRDQYDDYEEYKFIEYLEEVRKSKDITQAVLAVSLDIQPSVFANYIQKRSIPRMDFFIKWAQALGVTEIKL